MSGAVTLPEVDVTGAPPAAPDVAPQGVAALSMTPGMVAVTGQDGAVSQVRTEDAAAALAQGYRPSTRGEVTAEQMGTGGQVAAGLFGAARGVTLGLSDAALVEGSRLLGGDKEAEDTRQILNDAREGYAKTSIGGELAGSLAGMALLPGSGAARGAVAAEGALGRAAARFAAAVPRAATEGAAIGLGQQISEDALGNHEAVAEKYIASIAGGAVFGGLLGGALHAAGGAIGDKAGAMGRRVYGVPEALRAGADGIADTVQRTGDDVATAMRKVTGKDIEALAQREFGDVSPGLGEKVREAFIKGSAGVSGKDASVIDKLTRLDATGREARRVAVFDAEKELETAQVEFRKAGDGMLRSNKLTMEEFQGELKAEKMAAAVKKGNEDEVVSFVRGQIAKAIETAEAELQHAEGVAPQSIKSLEGIARTAYHAEAEIAAAIAKGESVNATAYMQLDRVKRDVQRWVSGGYNSVFRIADPFEARLAQRSVRTLDGLQEGMRKGLEDASLFGKAGEVQAAINADWTKQIDASKRFHQALTTEVGRDPSNPFRNIRGIDPAKADTYSRNLINPKADLTHQAVKDYVSSTESLAKTLRDNVELPPAKLAEVEATIQGAARFRAAIEKSEKTMTLVNQYKHLTANSGDGLAQLAGMVGFAGGGPAGGLIGATLGTIANPGRAVAQLAALERMSIKVDEKIGDAVRGFLGGAKAAATTAGRALTAGGEGAAQATQKVTASTVAAIREATQDPLTLTARVTQMLGGKGLDESAPRTSQFMASTAMRIGAYLRDKAPKDPAPTGVSFVAERPRKGSATEQARFAEAVQVANNPLTVVDDLRRGRVSREQVEALRGMYPQLYQQMRREIASQAVEMRPQLSTQQQIAISVLFDVPVSALMQPKVIASFLVTHAQAPAPVESGRPMQPTGIRGLQRKGSLASGFDKQETST